MKLGISSKFAAAVAVVTTFGLFSVDQPRIVQPAAAQTATTQTRTTVPSFVALTSNNTLVRYNSNNRSFSNPIRVSGTGNGTLLGIDYRPADRLLYGLTDANEIYTINPSTGAATRVSRLSTKFEGGFQSGVDFNPQVDRLRVVGSNDQNFRINVDTGEVTVDKDLTFPNPNQDPNITAEAYDQSFAGVADPTRPTPELYGIGYNSNFLVEQDPPNDGTLRYVGSLGVNIAPIAGFDIFTDSRRNDTGYVLSGSSLYTVNLDNGTARKVLSVPNGGFIGFSIRPVPLSGR